MTNFIGEYECKVDVKGRIMLPAGFRRKMGESDTYRFVIKRDMFVQCLEMYTIEAWDNMINLIMKNIKPINPDDQQCFRDFTSGATEVECDTAGRILIPGRLRKDADISNDALLKGQFGKIEIWSPELHANSGGDKNARSERALRILGSITYSDLI